MERRGRGVLFIFLRNNKTFFFFSGQVSRGKGRRTCWLIRREDSRENVGNDDDKQQDGEGDSENELSIQNIFHIFRCRILPYFHENEKSSKGKRNRIFFRFQTHLDLLNNVFSSAFLRNRLRKKLSFHLSESLPHQLGPLSHPLINHLPQH